MAKFRQGDLVLTPTQEIIQGSDVIIGAGGVANFTSLNLSGASVLDSLSATSLAISGLSTLSTLTFAAGATIDRIDSNPSLGILDTRVPTQNAVKTYVDAQIGGAVTPGTDEAIVRYNGTSAVQDSGIFIDDFDNITGVNNIDSTGDITCNDLYVSGDTLFVGTENIKSTSNHIHFTDNSIPAFRSTLYGLKLVSSSADTCEFSFSGDNARIHNNAPGGYIYMTATSPSITLKNVFYSQPSAHTNLYWNGNNVLRTAPTGIQGGSAVPAFNIRTSGGENGIIINNNGTVQLYYDNVLQLQTFANGFGFGQATSYLKTSSGTNAIGVVAGGKVELYNNNNPRLETTAIGIHVTGIVESDGLTLGDNDLIRLGTTIYKGTIYTDGTDIIIAKGQAGETMAKFIPDGANEFYYDGSKVGETTANGISGAVWG